ncbi:MAG: RNA methyltransferase [Burkholderiales bacterium]
MSAKRIASRENPLVKDLARLARSSRAQRTERVALLDGPHLIAAFAKTGQTARTIVVSDAGLSAREARELFERTPATERVIVADSLFDSLSPVANPVGLLACIDLPTKDALPAVIGDAVVLDRLQEPGNVGAILRTAAAAGVTTIIATPGTAYLWSTKVMRAAMGAHFGVRGMQLFEDIEIETLRAKIAGAVVATVLDATNDLYALDLRAPTVWLFGNEGEGLSTAARSVATTLARIPMPGASESLNVAASAAVCLFEQMRQRRAVTP